MASDNQRRKLQRQLRKARGRFLKVKGRPPEYSIRLSDTPMPRRARLTSEQKEIAKALGLSLVEYARGLKLFEARRKAGYV
jgi:hypothetical protein